MSGSRKLRLGRVLLAGVLVTAYGVSSWDAVRSTGPPPVTGRTEETGPHRSVDGGLPEHLAPPPALAVHQDHQAMSGSLAGIPAIVLDAYRRAGQRASVREPACHLPWQLLAAIGKVESDHAEQGAVDVAGTAIHPILGPALDGTNGYAAIPGDDPGADGTGPWARAMGPMQFIPSTWARWAVDGNGDGRADPENVYDATAAAADYLCADGRDLSTQDGLRAGILSYNDSARYLAVVWQWYQVYSLGVTPAPDQPGGTPALDVAVVVPVPPPATKPARPPTPPAPPSPPPTPPPAPPTSTPPPAPTPSPIPQPNPVSGVVTGLQTTVAGLLDSVWPSTVPKFES